MTRPPQTQKQSAIVGLATPTLEQDTVQAHEVVATTNAEYNRMAAAYRRGTADPDVSQNIAALLEAIEGEAPYVILDLGCAPGRDLRQFNALGHEAIGLDGSDELCAMARANTNCEVLHQDFLTLDLPPVSFTRFTPWPLTPITKCNFAASGVEFVRVPTERQHAVQLVHRTVCVVVHR